MQQVQRSLQQDEGCEITEPRGQRPCQCVVIQNPASKHAHAHSFVAGSRTRSSGVAGAGGQVEGQGLR